MELGRNGAERTGRMDTEREREEVNVFCFIHVYMYNVSMVPPPEPIIAIYTVLGAFLRLLWKGGAINVVASGVVA